MSDKKYLVAPCNYCNAFIYVWIDPGKTHSEKCRKCGKGNHKASNN